MTETPAEAPVPDDEIATEHFEVDPQVADEPVASVEDALTEPTYAEGSQDADVPQ